MGNVSYLFLTLLALWLIVLTKKLFFWTWLWQIKEYHLGRLRAHFSTQKGKELIFNYLNAAKLISILGLLFWFFLFLPLVFILYLIEALTFLYRFIRGSSKRPILTQKTFLILVSGLLLQFLFITWTISRPGLSAQFQIFLILFLLLDLLAPIIFSLLVLAFQPFAVFLRNRIIKKAIKKRETFKDLIAIGITGSYGKSSTKEFLAHILSKKYRVLKTKKNQNSEIGISRCILNELKPEHEIFVCEMGAYNCGGIKLLSQIAQPQIGILTGINEQHLATFGSQENIIKAKFELIESLPKDGVAILNGNDENLKSQMSRLGPDFNGQTKHKTLLCSTKEQTDVWAENIKLEKESISFRVVAKDENEAEFQVNLVGEQNVINLLLAAAAARELRMNLEEISQACQDLRPLTQTMQIKKGSGGVTIIDDSYSANPAGVEAALDYLKLYEGKKILVMPCLIELGNAAKKIHQKIGEKIGEMCDLAIITTQDYFQEIKMTAPETEVSLFESPQKILDKLKPYLKKGNVILLESRVPSQLIDWLTKN